MTCRDAIDAIARVEAGLLDRAESAALDQHIAECARCRRERALQVRLTAALRAGPEAAPPADFTARVLERIRADRMPELSVRWWTPIIPAMALAFSVLAIGLVLPVLPLPATTGVLRSLLQPALGWMQNILATPGLGGSPFGLTDLFPPYTLPAVVLTACLSAIMVWVTREAYACRRE